MEDIRDATHTPKREGRHLSLTFGTVLGGLLKYMLNLIFFLLYSNLNEYVLRVLSED